MAGEISLELIKPAEYFHKKVTAAQSQMRLTLDAQLEFYLVNLLCDFVDPSRLSTIFEDIDPLNTPLAFMLKKALEADTKRQIKIFKGMGDISLYFAGYFKDFFNGKPFDVDYYINMGATAFTKLSEILRNDYHDGHFSDVYRNIAGEFRVLVSVIEWISRDHSKTQIEELLISPRKSS